MHKIFLNTDCIFDDTIEILDDEFKHVKALRLRANDEIIVCDGQMNDYFCLVKNIYKDKAMLSIKKISKSNTELTKNIFLFQALTKADKFEFVIQKSVELGVNKIIPIICDYCDVKNNPGENKLARWHKISKSAAEQSGRGIIPKILEPMDFKSAVSFLNNIDLNFIAHEKSNCSIKNYSFNSDSIGIFVGPEGGFSESEIEFAASGNIKAVSLGKRILRTETAALFILSSIVFETQL